MVRTAPLRHIALMTKIQLLNRRSVLAFGAGAAACLLSKPALAAAPSNVVELFTSQGCSSCPPADKLAGTLSQRQGVLMLTYHVDYWDYLGWKDTLADPECSRRQYAYAKARGDMDVYTPQMIVNGGNHYVGSREDQIEAAIATAAEPWRAALSIAEDKGQITIKVGDGNYSGDAMLWLMALQRDATVKIERGEIAGKTITYHNIVRRIVPAGMWNGKAAQFVLPADTVLAPGCTGCAALLQDGKAGPMLAAAAWGDALA